MERTFGENFRGGRDNLVCPLCTPNLSHLDSQEESFTRCVFTKKQDQRSQKLTPREPKGNKTRGFKIKTSTHKLKSQYVSSAKQGNN